MKIAVLAVQGAFIEHEKVLESQEVNEGECATNPGAPATSDTKVFKYWMDENDVEFDFSTPQSLSIQKKETNQMKKKTKSSSSKSKHSITFKENSNQNLKTMSLSSLSSLLFTEDSNLSLSHPQSQDLISTDLNSKKRSSKSIQSTHDCSLFYHSSSSGSILLSYAFCS